MFWNERAFGDLLELLGDGPNPYQPIVENLEMTLDDCRRTSQQFGDIPLDKGIGAIANATYLATNLLEE